MAKHKKRRIKKKHNTNQQKKPSTIMQDKMISGYVRNNFAERIEEDFGIKLYCWQKKIINFIARRGR